LALRQVVTHPSYHAIFSTMARLIPLMIAGAVLASCSGSGGAIGDFMPVWAGGYSKEIPPRPGTPEYVAFRQKLDAEAVRDKSKSADASSEADAEKKSSPQQH
jgi:hypothetical protein